MLDCSIGFPELNTDDAILKALFPSSTKPSKACDRISKEYLVLTADSIALVGMTVPDMRDEGS